MRVDRIVVGLFAGGLLLTLVGCPGPASPTADLPANPLKPVAIEKPLTATDRPELLNGVGPVDEDAPNEFTETESGLKYRILRKSDGIKPTLSDSVTVHFRGWIDDGTEFFSTYERRQTTSFWLNQPNTGVKGWIEGLQLVGEGGMIELWVPSELGYGATGYGAAVPPHSTQHYLIEMIKVTHPDD